MLKYIKTNPCAMLRVGTSGSVGIDIASTRLISVSHVDRLITIGTDICLELSDNYYVKMYVRSSTHKKGICLANTVGVIDKDYRGEIIQVFRVDSAYNFEFVVNNLIESLTTTPLYLCQLIVHKHYDVTIEEVKCLSITERDNGGFGSTG